MYKNAQSIFFLLMLLHLSACASLVIGGGDAGGNDPRTRTEIEADAQITRQINRLYVKDAAIPATDIRVTTFRGVVILGGRVQDPRIQARAVALAEQVAGVTSVRVEFR